MPPASRGRYRVEGALPMTLMPDFRRKHLPHDVPMWIDPTREAFFVTVNCLPRGMNQLAKPEIWQAIEEAIRFREEKGDWQWNVILAMPDHFHGIVTFPEKFFLKKAMADWKRWLATKHKIRWQDDFFDRRLRSVESAMEKTDYIRMNPVRAALVDRAEDWPYQR
jgi:REP element-mobilizing transposase RayT